MFVKTWKGDIDMKNILMKFYYTYTDDLLYVRSDLFLVYIYFTHECMEACMDNNVPCKLLLHASWPPLVAFPFPFPYFRMHYSIV